MPFVIADGVLSSQEAYEMPADVCGIIAEYLAGDLAFGTLSSLNLTSRHVHLETSQALFETVLFTDAYYDYCMANPPTNLKYTRYAKSSTARGN